MYAHLKRLTWSGDSGLVWTQFLLKNGSFFIQVWVFPERASLSMDVVENEQELIGMKNEEILAHVVAHAATINLHPKVGEKDGYVFWS